MNIDYKIEKRGLVIEVDKKTRKQLRADYRGNPDRFDSDDYMSALFEDLVCNSELDWLDPSVTGDLTSAPMLAILGDEQEAPAWYKSETPGSGFVLVGGDRGVLYVRQVLSRWAFMPYQVCSVQHTLMEDGCAVFEGGPVQAGSLPQCSCREF